MSRLYVLNALRRLVLLNIPERGFVLVHMMGDHFEAWHDVTGSSFRVNLGAGFAQLLLDEWNVIKACFKVFNGCFEMFYKQDEKALYPPQINRPDYGRGFSTVAHAGSPILWLIDARLVGRRRGRWVRRVGATGISRG